MKKVFITGALGQVGQAVYDLLKDKPEYDLYLTASPMENEGFVKPLDITDREAVESEIISFYT